MVADSYRVDLDIYNGPLDLLLFLIRREEVDIYDIPIARITGQYVAYVGLLEELDPNLAGEYLLMVATLMEIKSRMLLPSPPPEEEGEEELLDPRRELVQQLLEYKRFKDAARDLGLRAEQHARRHPRQPPDLPRGEQTSVDVEEVQIWDLLAAFQKLMEQIGRAGTDHEIVYDDTPVTLHATDILERLQAEGGSLAFEIIFIGRSKSEMIGLFLALLELMRQKRVRAEQDKLFGQIVVYLIDATPITEVTVLGVRRADGDGADAATPTVADAEASEEESVNLFDDEPFDERPGVLRDDDAPDAAVRPPPGEPRSDEPRDESV